MDCHARDRADRVHDLLRHDRPADVAAPFAALTPDNTPAERRAMAIRGTLIATAILLVFALFGEAVLRLFISLPALRIAGGILLLIGIDMVFSRPSGGTTTTSEETAEAGAEGRHLGVPARDSLIAGPGAIGATTPWSSMPRATGCARWSWSWSCSGCCCSRFSCC